MHPSQIIQNCKNFVNQITNELPLFIKIIVCSTCSLYLINLIFKYISFILANIPYYTIYYFQIWRPITTVIMTTGILSIIFTFLFWFKNAIKLENSIGTVKYMLIFFINSICIQILYCIITFLFSIIIRNNFLLRMKIIQNEVRNTGLLPIVLCDITVLCLSNPDEKIQFLFIPFFIPSKYYPLLLFLIYTIFSMFYIDLESLCAIGYAYLYHKYLKNKLVISNNLATKFENSILFRWMKNKKGFVNLGGIQSPELQNNLEGVKSVNISGNNDTQNGFKAFQGNSVRVGSSENNVEASKNNIEYTNVTVGSTGAQDDSGETKLDIGSPRPNI